MIASQSSVVLKHLYGLNRGEDNEVHELKRRARLVLPDERAVRAVITIPAR